MIRFVAIGLSFALISGCTDDTLDTSYGSYEVMRADKALERGWLAPWIPKNAILIKEVHNLDNNLSAFKFELSPGTTFNPPDSCTPLPPTELRAPVFDRYWIPSLSELRTRYDLKSCSTGFLAISADRKVFFHWSRHAL